METLQAKPSRWKLRLRRAMFALAAFITVVALFVAEEDWRGARAWQSYKSEMEAKGEHFDAARLIPPKVPDDQNFAMTPCFAPYFDLSPDTLRQPVKEQSNDGQQLVEAADSRKPYILLPWFNRAVTRPPHPLGWNYGMAADLPAWAATIKGTNAEPPSDTIASPVQAAAFILDNMQSIEPTLAELQSASQRPYSRFNLPYENIGNGQVVSALLGQLAAAKHVYQVLSLHAESELVLGQCDQALSDINIMFRVDDGLKDEPIVISQLVRMAGVAILLQPVGEGLAEHRWSDAQLQVLQDRLQRADVLASTVKGLYGERDVFFPSAVAQFMPSSPITHGWNRLEQLNLLRMYPENLLPRFDLVGRKINPSVSQTFDLKAQKASEEIFASAFFHHRIMAKMELPALIRIPEKAARAQSEVDLSMVACALERYRLAEGHYPEMLNELVPRFATSLPHDIINGEPLHYRRTDDGRFILYSVGWNEKDDGGTVAPTKTNPPRQDFEQGDCVLEYPKQN